MDGSCLAGWHELTSELMYVPFDGRPNGAQQTAPLLGWNIKRHRAAKKRTYFSFFFCLSLSLYLSVSIESSVNERTSCPVLPPFRHPSCLTEFSPSCLWCSTLLTFIHIPSWEVRHALFPCLWGTISNSSSGAIFCDTKAKGCLSTVLHRERRHGGAASLLGVPAHRPRVGHAPNVQWQMAIIFVCSSWIHQTLAF